MFVFNYELHAPGNILYRVPLSVVSDENFVSI